MSSPVTNPNEVLVLLKKPTLTSIEACKVLGCYDGDNSICHRRMCVAFRAGVIERVPGFQPYVWTTKSVIAYANSGRKARPHSRTAGRRSSATGKRKQSATK